MNTVTIRRNAFKKISTILSIAKGAIAYSAHMRSTIHTTLITV
jgi:hypothetical protein